MNIKKIIITAMLAVPAFGTVSAQFDEAIEVDFYDSERGRQKQQIKVPPSRAVFNESDQRTKDYYVSLHLENASAQAADIQDLPFPDDDELRRRMMRLPCTVEMTVNEAVRKTIQRYARMKSSVAYWLGASNYYFPFFEEALLKYNVPLELKYLSIIESGLNPKAVSPVGAGGLWQFMPFTGKEYGLKIDSMIDERNDVIKGTDAAARFLAKLYGIFGDWQLAIAAYNCGPGRVNQAIHRAGGQRNFWKIYPYLPAETRGYVPAFIAATYIMNYYCDHGITPQRCRLPEQTDTMMVNRDVHFRQIADVCNIPIETLRSLNPQYKNDIVHGSTGAKAIRMELNDCNTFIDFEDSIYNYRTDLVSHRIYHAGNGGSSGKRRRR